jgi:hypothetical protein
MQTYTWVTSPEPHNIKRYRTQAEFKKEYHMHGVYPLRIKFRFETVIVAIHENSIIDMTGKPSIPVSVKCLTIEDANKYNFHAVGSSDPYCKYSEILVDKNNQWTTIGRAWTGAMFDNTKNSDEYYGPQYKLDAETNKYKPVPGFHKNLYGATFMNGDIATGNVTTKNGIAYYDAVDKQGRTYQTEETPLVNIKNRMPEAVMAFAEHNNKTSFAWKCEHNGIAALGDSKEEAQTNWISACVKKGVPVNGPEHQKNDHFKLNDEQRYYIETFTMLIQTGETVSGAELSKRIKDVYDVKDQKIKLAVLTLKNLDCNITRTQRGIITSLNCEYAVYRKNNNYQINSFEHNSNAPGIVLVGTGKTIKQCESIISKLKGKESGHGL